VKHLSAKNSVDSVRMEMLTSMSIFFPEYSEQQKIASFLEKTDSWIENLKQQKQELEKYKKGLMQKIFAKEFRFKDENGNNFPEWEEKKSAGEIFNDHSNKNHNGDLPLLAVTQEDGVVYRKDLKLKINSSETGIKNYKIIEAAILSLALDHFKVE
jgi:type I restriction enzyme S subunit